MEDGRWRKNGGVGGGGGGRGSQLRNCGSACVDAGEEEGYLIGLCIVMFHV